MPKRTDIKTILLIGSGPIIIGQACEFDYSGTQACKALRKLGYEIVLANSNPATIMTDPGMADVTYIEPLDLETVTEIVKQERPDALLPNLGGQTGLNLSAELAKAGVLVEEARITHLAYAPEIAGAMLRRQQAEAIIAARRKIVHGAVSMVEMALKDLTEKDVVELDEERKATMVSNLLVVLCGETEGEGSR